MIANLSNILLSVQCILGYSSACQSNSNSCTVGSTSGYLVGDCSSQNIHKFLGIPYAQPPINNLRFADPKEYRASSRTALKVKTLPDYCPQSGGDTPYSEDCLYLNVWAPPTRGNKPVLFWVHGGSNTDGGSADPIFDGTNFAKSQDVVVVSFNYRLGILGFYDDGSNTNFAVKDAIMALKWVYNNINQFGGNPRKITVFGNSSGGSLIRALLAAPSAAGIINNVIFQSDPQNYGFNKRAVSNDIIGSLTRELLNCDTLACLRQASIADILTAQSSIVSYAVGTSSMDVNKAYPFGPNIDNSILFKDYSAALEDGSLATKADMITGFVDQEAGPTIGSVVSVAVPESYYELIMAVFLGSTKASALIASNAAFTDIIDGNGSDATREQLVYTGSDFFWQCPIQYNANLLLGSKNVYVYSMSKGIQHPSNAAISLCDNAVCHQDDLYFTFGTYPSGTSSDLQQISSQLQTRWANFARSGNPNYNNGVQWSKASSQSSLNILDFGSNTISSGYEYQACQDMQGAIEYSFQEFST